MALTPEEEKRLAELDAQFGDTSSAPAAPTAQDREAQLIAQFGEPVPAPAPPAPPKEAPGVGSQILNAAKGFGQGAIDATIDLPYNLNQLATVASDAVESVPYLGEGFKAWKKYNPVKQVSDYVQDQLPGELTGEKRISDLPGLSQAKDVLASREFPKGEAPVSDAARIAAEWGVGGLPNAARRGLKAALPDILGGVGAAAGDTVATEVFDSESPWGELVGGIAGMFAGSKGPRKAKAKAEAFDFVNENLADADATVAQVQQNVDQGIAGTTADLGGEQGLFDIEAGVGVDRGTRDALAARGQERAQQIASDVQTPFAGGAPKEAAAAAQDLTQRRADVVRAGLQEEQAGIAGQEAQATQALAERGRIAQASDASARSQAQLQAQRAQEAGLPLATDKTRAQASIEARNTIDAADEAFKIAEEQPKWRAFTEGPPVDVGALYTDTNAYLRDLAPGDKGALLKEYEPLIEEANAWKKAGTAAPGDVSGFFSRFRSAIDENRSKSVSGKGSNSDRLAAGLLSDMQDSLATDLNPLYREAKDATAELYDRWRSGPLGDARRAEPEQFTGRAGGVADEGGAVYSRQLENAGALDTLAESLKADARRSGGVTDDFLLRNEDAINRLPPETQKQFRDSAAANTARDVSADAATEQTRLSQAAQKQIDREGGALKASVKQQNKEAEKAANRLEKTRTKNIVSDYGGAPKTTMRSLLRNSDRLDELTLLRRYMDNAGKGDALRADIGRELGNMLTPPKGGTIQDVKPKAIDDYNKLREQLVESGALTAQEAADIGETLNRTLTTQQRATAVKSMMNRAGNEYDNLVASGLAAGVLSGMPGTQTLLVGGAVRRYIKRLMTSREIKPEQVAALERLMTNPQEFLDAAAGAKTAKEAARSIVTEAVGAGQTGAAFTEEEN